MWDVIVLIPGHYLSIYFKCCQQFHKGGALLGTMFLVTVGYSWVLSRVTLNMIKLADKEDKNELLDEFKYGHIVQFLLEYVVREC